MPSFRKATNRAPPVDASASRDALNEYTGPFFVQENKSQHEVAIDGLKEELKLVQWQKLATESSLQASIMRTRQTRLETKESKQRREREARAVKRKVIKGAMEEERNKPLVMDRENKAKLEEEEKRNASSKARQVKRRLDSVSELKEIVGQREETRGRRVKCDAIKRKIDAEQRRRSDGGGTSFASSRRGMGSNSSYVGNEVGKQLTYLEITNHKETPLPSVLTTLNKVLSLEERIRQLSDSQHAKAQDWILLARGPAFNKGSSPSRHPLSNRRQTIIQRMDPKKSLQHVESLVPKKRRRGDSEVPSRSPAGIAGSQTEQPPLTNEIAPSNQGDAEMASSLSCANNEEPERQPRGTIPDMPYFRAVQQVSRLAANFDHLKMATNVPSQNRIKGFEKLKRTRRRSF